MDDEVWARPHRDHHIASAVPGPPQPRFLVRRTLTDEAATPN